MRCWRLIVSATSTCFLMKRVQRHFGEEVSLNYGQSWTPSLRGPGGPRWLLLNWTPESTRYPPEESSQVFDFTKLSGDLGWIPSGVDSQKDRLDASEIARCAPHNSIYAERDPQNQRVRHRSSSSLATCGFGQRNRSINAFVSRSPFRCSQPVRPWSQITPAEEKGKPLRCLTKNCIAFTKGVDRPNLA